MDCIFNPRLDTVASSVALLPCQRKHTTAEGHDPPESLAKLLIVLGFQIVFATYSLYQIWTSGQ